MPLKSERFNALCLFLYNCVGMNVVQTGFYLVNYSEERWIALKSGIEQGAFSELDRLGLQACVLLCL